MKVTTARLLLAAAIAGTALLSLNSAFAAGTHAGDDYGYVHSATDAYTDGARKVDAFSDGARTVFQDYPFGFAV
ncbi:hypothetical protein [Cupriavidus basilensis]|uniref:hypothetical protein n=1 Tax=Cupriavidus basilensis TaxID=68895 RepID=UPI0023E765A2|nr:hypothetical protein [Cupriavidus basilensis]MDF3887748.1 hypothetical protein [Cupriavidus basilensis]